MIANNDLIDTKMEKSQTDLINIPSISCLNQTPAKSIAQLKQIEGQNSKNSANSVHKNLTTHLHTSKYGETRKNQ